MITIINVKKITENDRLSPIGGEKLGKKVLNELKRSEEVILDFTDAGSHTSLFFNAFYGFILNNAKIEVIEKISFKEATKLDEMTNQKCKENSIRIYSDENYKHSLEKLDHGSEI